MNKPARTQSAPSTSNGQPLQRFTRERPCPVCGGCPDDPRGAGKRCAGFIQGDWIYCTREEFGAGCHHLPTTSPESWSHRLRGKCKCGSEHNPAPAKQEIECVDPYHDANGQVVHETIKYRNPKGFSQRRPDGKGGYIYKNVFVGITPVLFDLPAILAAEPSQPVWICEGEKDAKNLKAKGLLATTNPMGAMKWRDHYSEYLRGRTCYISPHNDAPSQDYPDGGKGRHHARAVARSLHGKAAGIKIVEIPDLPKGGDVSDFLARGGTVDQLNELARRTAEWKPSAESESQPASSEERFANFRARIVREIVRHETGETTRHVVVEAIHDDDTVATATVAAEDFESMSWVVTPTRDEIRDRLRAQRERSISALHPGQFLSPAGRTA